MIKLSTERLKLEPQTAEHAEALFAGFQSPELYPYIQRSPPKDLGTFRDWLRALESRSSPDGKERWINWASFSRETGECVGQIEVTIHVESLDANLAYTTFLSHQGKAYAKEACREVVRHLFDQYEVKRFIIEMDARNTASVRLAESLYATRVAFTPRVQIVHGEWSDEYRYELFPS